MKVRLSLIQSRLNIRIRNGSPGRRLEGIWINNQGSLSLIWKSGVEQCFLRNRDFF